MFFQKCGTEMKPTKKGISLTLQRWQQLTNAVEALDRLLNDGYNSTGIIHLGGNVHAEKSKGWNSIDLRKWWIPDNSTAIAPTKKGICLRNAEWVNLTFHIGTINSYIPEMVEVTPCFQSECHQNQLGFYNCPECNPNNGTTGLYKEATIDLTS